MSKPKVLFLCTGNSARSQMAEAFLKKHGDDTYRLNEIEIFEPPLEHPFNRADRISFFLD